MQLHSKFFLGMFLSLSLLCSSISFADPENSGDRVLSFPGAIALEAYFSDAQNGAITVRDRNGHDVGKFSRISRVGQRVLVLGDALRIEGHCSRQSIRPLSYSEFVFIPRYDYGKFTGSLNDQLKDDLHEAIKNHISLGYRPAREKMYGEYDNEGGRVQGVYTGKWVVTNGIPNPAEMNTEHTWPKSKGAEREPALSDMFHLFPTDPLANQKRANFPFGVVVDIFWQEGGSFLGRDSSGQTVFMPREQHRGNAARAIFYFSIRYRIAIDERQEQVLKSWHAADPVDQRERARNDAIAQYQKNRNPFIDQPHLVEAIDDF